MRYPAILLSALALSACADDMSGPSAEFPEDVQACKEAMAFRESTTPTFIEVVSAAPLRDGSGIQMFMTHNGENMNICRTDRSHKVTELFPYGQ
jgi:hypothetical protein